MPRYYFDVHRPETCSHDAAGMELPDCRAAFKEAIEALLLLVQRELPPQPVNEQVTTDVWDEAGRMVVSVRLLFGTESLQTHE